MAGGKRRTRRHPDKWAQRRKMRGLVRWQRDNASLTNGSYSRMIERVGAALAEVSPFFKELADVVTKSLANLTLFGNTYLESAFAVPEHLLGLSAAERAYSNRQRMVIVGGTAGGGKTESLRQAIRESLTTDSVTYFGETFRDPLVHDEIDGTKQLNEGAGLDNGDTTERGAAGD